MLINQKILYMFNKFFIAFVKDVKNGAAEIKSIISKNYKVINKLSTDHLDFFWDSCGVEFLSKLATLPCEELDKDDKVLSSQVLKEISVGDILGKLQTEETKATFWNHIYILTLFAYIYNENKAEINEELDEIIEEDPDAVDQADVLFNKVVNVLSIIQKGQDITAEIDDVLDEDVKGVLIKISNNKLAQKAIPEDNDTSSGDPSPNLNIADIFGSIAGDSKIANLAKEISEEIDVSKLNIEKPEDIMKMMDFSGGNSVMGDIIKKVSSKITNKIENGELGQDELLGEAMSMMQMMGKSGGLGNILNNPMMNEIFKGMKKNKPMQTREDLINREATKERLRKKLDERKKKINI